MSAPGASAALTPPAARRQWYLWLLVSAAVIVADQATKAAILGAFRPGEYKVVLPLFTLVLSFNTGAAFSFLAGQSGWQRWLFTGIAVAATLMIVWLLRRARDRWYALGLALILGGALGNLWDRVTIGAVVDFLLFHYRDWYFPAFNVADSAITVGAGLLILDAVMQRHAHDARSAAGRGAHEGS